MVVEAHYQKEIVGILTRIFPGVLIYYFGQSAKKEDSDNKEPEMDIVLDLGRSIGDRDLVQAQKALSETDIPYTIYLYDLNSVSEVERKTIISKAVAWKL